MSNTQPEIIEIPAHTDEVCCDGGSTAMGHPLVYYSFDKQNEVSCGYCGRVFRKKTH